MNRYKAAVIRQGAEVENVYGTDQAKVLRRALKKLNTPLPTCPALRVILYEQDKKLSGNFATWKTLQTVEYQNEG